VQAVIDELGGEKIDIVEWDKDPKKFIANALSPAKILNAELDEEKQEARVSVPVDQLSLAIGKQGQNVRLAAKLTGWKIDVLGGEIKEEEDKEESAGNKEEAKPKEKNAKNSAKQKEEKEIEEK